MDNYNKPIKIIFTSMESNCTTLISLILFNIFMRIICDNGDLCSYYLDYHASSPSRIYPIYDDSSPYRPSSCLTDATDNRPVVCIGIYLLI